MQEDVGIYENTYGPSVPHLQGKIVCYKVQHVEPIIVLNVPKGILDRYKKVYLWCDLIHIKGIELLNTTYWQIIVTMGSMIKNWKVKGIEYGIKQSKKRHLQRGFKITRIHSDS